MMGSRRCRRSAATILVVLAVLFIAAELYRRHDFTDYFLERKSHLAAADLSLREEGDGWQRFDVALRDHRGVETTAILQVPTAGTNGPDRTLNTRRIRDTGGVHDAGRTGPVSGGVQPGAAFILLAGLRTNKRAIEYIEDVGNVVMLALDYPYEGKRSQLGAGEFLVRLPRMRRAVLDTPAAVTLAVDFLMSRREVDRSRIVLVGGSIGALVGPAAVATEPRIAGAAFLFGAGDLETLIAANIPAPRRVASMGAWLASLVTSPIEPTKYIGQIAPRPVFMLSGRFDERMPESCSRALHDAAGEPRTIRWIDTEHVHVRSERFQKLVRTELEAWLREMGFL